MLDPFTAQMGSTRCQSVDIDIARTKGSELKQPPPTQSHCPRALREKKIKERIPTIFPWKKSFILLREKRKIGSLPLTHSRRIFACPLKRAPISMGWPDPNSYSCMHVVLRVCLLACLGFVVVISLWPGKIDAVGRAQGKGKGFLFSDVFYLRQLS